MSLPSGATFVVGAAKGAGVFSWTPQADQSGSYEVVFTAVDAIDDALRSERRVRMTVRETQPAIAGTVITDQGQSMEGVMISVRSSSEVVAQVVTDPLGRYVAANLSPGTYLLKPSYQPPQVFSPLPRKLQIMVFNPSQRRAILKSGDRRGMDFVASAK